MKNKRVILTEGKMDSEILKAVLPETVASESEFIPTDGYSSALSIARTLLSRSGFIIALVLDANTTDEVTLNSKRAFVESYLGTANNKKFNVFLFKPDVESIITANKSILQDALGKKITDSEWNLAKNSPKLYFKEKQLPMILINKKSLRAKPEIKNNDVIRALVKYLKK